MLRVSPSAGGRRDLARRVKTPTATAISTKPSNIHNSIGCPRRPGGTSATASEAAQRGCDRRQHRLGHGCVAGLRQVVEVNIDGLCPIVKKPREIDRIGGAEKFGTAPALGDDLSVKPPS